MEVLFIFDRGRDESFTLGQLGQLGGGEGLR